MHLLRTLTVSPTCQHVQRQVEFLHKRMHHEYTGFGLPRTFEYGGSNSGSLDRLSR